MTYWMYDYITKNTRKGHYWGYITYTWQVIFTVFFKVLDTKLFSYFQFIVAIIVIFVNISSCWVSVVYLHQDTYNKKLLKQAQNKPQTTNYTENMVCLSLSTPNFTKLVILREINVVVIIPPFLVYNRICDSSNGIHVSNFVKLQFLAFSIPCFDVL
jgi:hypothetical protein